jgi:hypothetical protein
MRCGPHAIACHGRSGGGSLRRAARALSSTVVTADSPTAPVLLVLAAGLGSRYGGLKQMETVGPGGATLMDYAVFDAARAGFGAAVFVVRPEMDPAFSDQVLPRFVGRLAVRTAHQRFDLPPGFAIPPGRTKPWGTAHAVLAAADAIGAPFAVINADDFYGREAYAAVGEFLRAPQPAGPPTYALAGFRLARTTSDAGPVNRAVCHVTADGWLRSVSEVLHIAADGAGGFRGEEHGRTLRLGGDELVSMNMWAFTPALFAPLRAGFEDFLRATPSSGDAGPAAGTPSAGHPPTGEATKREYLIPTAVQDLIGRGAARVRVIPTESRWTGMTHPEDRMVVEARIREMVAGGEYPEILW